MAPFTSPLAEELAPDLLERFLRYVRVDTQSGRDGTTAAEHAGPARPRAAARRGAPGRRPRRRRARRQRLRDRDAARRPSTARRSIGLIAHVDTSPDAPGAGVEPIVHRDYDGGADRAAARRHRARPGGDARAGRARRATTSSPPAATRCSAPTTRPASPRSWPRSRTWSRTPSCRARRCASASRPTRRSARARRCSTSSASAPRCAYTLDGSDLGELQDETFTAAEVDRRRSTASTSHPGCAKGMLVNAARLAGRDRSPRCPPELTPERTEGRDGFIHVYEVDGDRRRRATIRAIVRDFDDDLLARARRAAARAPPRRSSAREPRARLEIDVAPAVPEHAHATSTRFPEVVDGRRARRSAPRGSSRSARRSAAAPTARG